MIDLLTLKRCHRQQFGGSLRRLLYVVTEDWFFCSHWLEWARAAQARGFEVAVATRVGSAAQRISLAGIRVIDFTIDRSGMNPIKETLTVLRLVRLLRREAPDLLHLVALKPVLLGSIAARLAGVRSAVGAVTGMGWLYTEGNGRGFAARLVGWLVPLLLRRIQIYVENPDDQAQLALMGLDRQRIALIRGAGIDTRLFRTGADHEGRPVVLLPARLLWNKGVGEFVQAARHLHAQGHIARFVLAGAPDHENPASVPEAEIKAWTDEGVVEWWGYCEDMQRVYLRATVVCLPSYREGLPKALLEAMSCGRAVVATDTPGCREAVRHGDNGLLVPVGDPVALAAAIQVLLTDSDLRASMGARGRERAEQEFDQNIVIGEILTLYRKVLAG